jgi:hypothetical protein
MVLARYHKGWMLQTDGWMDGIIYHCNGWMRKEIEHKFAFAANKYSALPQMLGSHNFFF